MLAQERRALILSRLSREGRLVATDFARELDLSEDTIRRDLRDLAAEGLLARVHGGALPVAPPLPDLGTRLTIDRDEKQALARAAVSLIRPGMTVFLDGGSTHRAMIEHLPRDVAFTVITHSPTIAVALESFERIDVQVIGGRLYRHSMVSVGAECAEAISRISPDIAFLGVTGVSNAQGLTTGDIEEAAIKRAFASRSRRLVVLVTRAKLGVASPATILPLSAVTDLVLADPVDPVHMDMAAHNGISVIVA